MEDGIIVLIVIVCLAVGIFVGYLIGHGTLNSWSNRIDGDLNSDGLAALHQKLIDHEYEDESRSSTKKNGTGNKNSIPSL